MAAGQSGSALLGVGRLRCRSGVLRLLLLTQAAVQGLCQAGYELFFLRGKGDSQCADAGQSLSPDVSIAGVDCHSQVPGLAHLQHNPTPCGQAFNQLVLCPLQTSCLHADYAITWVVTIHKHCHIATVLP